MWDTRQREARLHTPKQMKDLQFGMSSPTSVHDNRHVPCKPVFINLEHLLQYNIRLMQNPQLELLRIRRIYRPVHLLTVC